MPVAALALVLLAAFFHAGYNYLAKASRDTNAFLWWCVTLGTLVYPIYLLISGQGLALAPETIPIFLLSSLAEVGYFYGLVRAYALGDLSVVYPISRGSAPLFVTLWSALALSERLPFLGYAGIALMIAGVYVASLTASGGAAARLETIQESDSMTLPAAAPTSAAFNWRSLVAPFHNHAARWALLSGVFIAIYSLNDRTAIKTTPPLVYNLWVNLSNTITWGLVVWNRQNAARTVLGELRLNWRRLFFASLMTLGSYALVLVAQTMTSTSYVVAGRGTSVVIGALLGTIVLREGFGVVRVTSALMMLAGLVLIAVG